MEHDDVVQITRKPGRPPKNDSKVVGKVPKT